MIDFLDKGLGTLRRATEAEGWGVPVGVGFWKSFGQSWQRYPETLKYRHYMKREAE